MQYIHTHTAHQRQHKTLLCTGKHEKKKEITDSKNGKNNFIFSHLKKKQNPKADFLITTCLAVVGANNTAKKRAFDGLSLPFKKLFLSSVVL